MARAKRHVYFFRDLRTGLIKIGITKRPLIDRQRQLQSEHKTDLLFLGVLEGDYDVELLMHRCFESLRQGNTEWFTASDELLTFIRENTSPDMNVFGSEGFEQRRLRLKTYLKQDGI